MKNTITTAVMANHVTDLINVETGSVSEIRYLPGYPQVVRFDASRGIFNVNGNIPLTKKGEPFTIMPVAFRIFKDNILGFGLKRWAEFFFISEQKTVCNLLVHGYSVENLMHSIQEMYYDGSGLCDVALTLKPVEKTNKETGSKYFIAEFSFKKLEASTVAILQAATIGLHIWREDTLTGDAVVELSGNFQPPTRHINGSGTIEEPVEAIVEG
jgi:hypothetical protein